MKFMLMIAFSLVMSAIGVGAQNNDHKHPRVIELEDRMTNESAHYFSRRYPNEPFLIKVEIVPFRRVKDQGGKGSSLPYLDYESEELIDEWDDLSVPLNFLKNRVSKVTVDVSVPENFSDISLSEIKQELPVFLRLLPYRDEIRIERKFKTKPEDVPFFVYIIAAGLLTGSLVIGLMMRWSVSRIKPSTVNSTSASPGVSVGASYQNATPKMEKNKSTEVKGDVTFHDPIKTLDIVHIKLKQIQESGTFPTLKDIIEMNAMCIEAPERLGALIYELPQEWQKTLLYFGNGEKWLHAFCSPSRIDQDCLNLLDKLGRQRDFSGANRQEENLLIQIWRLGVQAGAFLKGINQDHAFILMSVLPKSLSLKIAKKTFPGSWGRLLESNTSNVLLDPDLAREYMNSALQIFPYYHQDLLQSYVKDKEILNYLDEVSIEDERDIYETLSADSFIHKVRPPFYQVFNLDDPKLTLLINSYPLDKWALVVMNSSRSYVKKIMDHLDDKKKVVFSSHLRQLDGGISSQEQIEWRKVIAQEVANFLIMEEKEYHPEVQEAGDHVVKKTA